MAAFTVRCPFCGKRFDVGGIPAGTRLRCSGCTAVLAVPARGRRSPGAGPWRSRIARGAAGGGLLAAVAVIVYMGIRLAVPPAGSPETASASPPAPLPEVSTPAPDRPLNANLSGLLIDPVARVKQQLRDEFGDVFLFYSRGDPYLLAVESSERYIGTPAVMDYGRRLEILQAAFRRELADPLGIPPVSEVLPLVVLASREGFERYFMEREKKRVPPQIRGIYEYNRRRIVIYFDVQAPYEVLFHEGIHQLVHHYVLRETGDARVPQMFWLQEGLATYFEGFRPAPDGGIAIDPRAHRGRLPVIREALQEPTPEGRRRFIPLGVLAGMTVDDFWEWFESERDTAEATRKAHLYYAESWALVHFLRQSGGPYQTAFNDYFRAELRGEGGKGRLEAVLRARLGMELGEVEEKFVDYLLRLP